MASASGSNPSTHNNTPSSHFLKTVCLHDWWLIKAENDFNVKRLAVAGFTSREQQAVRVFSSAPIIKRYDVFTLETADGVCVIIKGFINKFRTNKNGFSSEVFSHFLFGFPPYWEEYAEKCLRGEFTSGVVSRSDLLTTHSGIVAGTKSSSPNLMCSLLEEEIPNKYERAIDEERHDNSQHIMEEIDLGLEDSANVLLAKEQRNLHHSACNESSIEVLEECSSQHVSEKITDDASKGSDLQNHVVDLLSCVENEKNKGRLKSGSTNFSTVSLSGDPKVESLSTAPTIGNRKILELSGTCIDDTMKYPTVESGFEVNITTPSKVDMNTVNLISSKFGSRTSNSLKNLKGNQKEKPASRCYAKYKNNELNSISEAFENPDEEKLNRNSSITTVQSGGEKDISAEIPSRSEGRMSKCWSRNIMRKQKEDQTALGRLETERNKLGSVSVSSDHVSNVVLQEPMHEITPKKLDDGCAKDDSQHDCEFSSVGTDAKQEHNHGNIMIRAGMQSKSTNESVRSSIRLGDVNHTNDMEIAVGKRETNAKSTSGKKTKRKLLYVTHEDPFTQEGKKKTSIVSPESLSFKRSRSGRLLVPALDFWRNQMAVYDADRGITRIQEGLHVVEPSRGLSPSTVRTGNFVVGSRSEPQKK